MTTHLISNKIKKFLERKKKIPNRYLKNILDFNYLDTGFVDSLELTEFIIFVEKKFKIKLTSTEINSSKFRTIKGLVKIISKKIVD